MKVGQMLMLMQEMERENRNRCKWMMRNENHDNAELKQA